MGFLYISLYLLFTFIFIQTLRSIFGKRPSGKLPPGPKPFPIIGNLLEVGEKPHKSLAKLATTHGPIMSLKLGQVTTIVISSASTAREVLQKHDAALSHRAAPNTIRAHEHYQYSVSWLPPTSTWRDLRKIMNTNMFTGQKLDAGEHLRRKKVQELMAEVQESVRSGEAMEIGQAVFRTSLNVISNTLFSIDLVDRDSATAREFMSVVVDVMENIGNPSLADWFHVLGKIDPNGGSRRLGALFTKMLAIFDRLIEERLARTSGLSNDDVLDVLLRMHGEENLHMNYIKHLLLDLFVAGTDTTSNTVEWAIACLLRSPEKLRTARAELAHTVGRGNQVKESDILNLPYLHACVKEAMRLHPVGPILLPRKSEVDVEICGFTISKGAQVLVNVWAIGRDPTTWEDPESFVPERFLGSKIDVRGRDFELIPFGAGRRICPGMPLAMRMVPLLVASLIHDVEWKLENGGKAEEINMDDKFGAILSMAHPLKVVPNLVT